MSTMLIDFSLVLFALSLNLLDGFFAAVEFAMAQAARHARRGHHARKRLARVHPKLDSIGRQPDCLLDMPTERRAVHSRHKRIFSPNITSHIRFDERQGDPSRGGDNDDRHPATRGLIATIG